jgi:hypothetical protein
VPRRAFAPPTRPPDRQLAAVDKPVVGVFDVGFILPARHEIVGQHEQRDRKIVLVCEHCHFPDLFIEPNARWHVHADATVNQSVLPRRE